MIPTLFRRHLMFMLIGVGVVVSTMAIPTIARAHFLWLTAEEGLEDNPSAEVHAFLSEIPIADLPEFKKYIASAKYTVGDEELEPTEGEDTYLIAIPTPTPARIDGTCDLGTMSRGGVETFRLLYTARVQFQPDSVDADDRSDGLWGRWVTLDDGSNSVLVTFQGEPVEGAEVKAFLDDGSELELATDAQGLVTCPGIEAGEAGFLIRWADGTSGKYEDKEFGESRFFMTLTVAKPGLRPQDAGPSSPEIGGPAHGRIEDQVFASLPDPTNSFGGAVLDGFLYVYSGHTGTTHRYHKATTLPHFRRIALETPTTWEELPCGPAVQGVALVSDGEALYRVGGMSAHNDEGEPQDLISIADVARFDPESGRWADLPELPEPRSTHDAAVLDGYLYVIGGWSMGGGDWSSAYFIDEALRMNLRDPQSGWEPLPTPPFRRRALAVAAFDGRLFVLGGLDEGGKVVRRVDIYDPATDAWTRGPDLPGGRFQGFGCSAFEIDRCLVTNGADGRIYRLNDEENGWDDIAEAVVPRITHRLLPGSDGSILLIGGNAFGEPTRFIEKISPDVIDFGNPASSPSLRLRFPYSGLAAKSQAIALIGDKLMIVDGNSSPNPHAFEREYLVDEVWSFSLGELTLDSEPALPTPLQSSTLIQGPRGALPIDTTPDGRRRTATYLLGGFGVDGDRVRTLGGIFRDDGDRWTRLEASIPDARGMFNATTADGSIWIFGGSVYDPNASGRSSRQPDEVLRWSPAEQGSTFEVTEHRLPTTRRSFAGAQLDGHYYLIGGLGVNGKLVETVDVFNFESGQWELAPAPRRPRLFADLVAVDGRLYLAGGYVKGESRHFERDPSIEVYDPDSETWSIAAESMPVEPRNARLLEARGRLLFVSIDPDNGEGEIVLWTPPSTN